MYNKVPLCQSAEQEVDSASLFGLDIDHDVALTMNVRTKRERVPRKHGASATSPNWSPGPRVQTAAFSGAFS